VGTDVVLDADIDNVNDRVQIIAIVVHQVDNNNEKAHRSDQREQLENKTAQA
jgi:DNA/RNA-binding domain of Phe-tRNA-synthetase-like protein